MASSSKSLSWIPVLKIELSCCNINCVYIPTKVMCLHNHNHGPIMYVQIIVKNRISKDAEAKFGLLSEP